MAIVVFGSINMDLVVRAPRLPAAGETLIGRSFFSVPGGKGANQAVACARLGATTRLIGRVGDDMFGGELRASLVGYGVEVGGVATHPGQPSGVALIVVDDAAENSIVAVPGANGLVSSDDVARLEDALEGARVLLLQLEVPLAAVLAAALAARRRGATVILDPAPARPIPSELYAASDILTPNETEAAALVGFAIDDEQAAARAAEALLARGAGAVVVKMGGKGAYWTDGTRGQYVPALRVDAVDSVGAGDAFNGGLAVALSEGRSLAEAIGWGMAAGALSVTRAGAQPSMPDRAAVIALLN